MTCERTPLVDQDDSSATRPVQPSSSEPTPLPKLQLFAVYYIQFGEPLAASVIYPFVVQLVRETGITGRDEAKTGYYAGFIVRYRYRLKPPSPTDPSTQGIYLFRCGRPDRVVVGACV